MSTDEQLTAPAGEPPAVSLEGWTEPGNKGATILRLEEPVELRGGVNVTRLVIARLRAKHMREARDGSIDSKLNVLASAASEDRAVIDGLGIADMLRAIAVVDMGFPSGPPSGGAS